MKYPSIGAPYKIYVASRILIYMVLFVPFLADHAKGVK